MLCEIAPELQATEIDNAQIIANHTNGAAWHLKTDNVFRWRIVSPPSRGKIAKVPKRTAAETRVTGAMYRYNCNIGPMPFNALQWLATIESHCVWPCIQDNLLPCALWNGPLLITSAVEITEEIWIFQQLDIWIKMRISWQMAENHLADKHLVKNV